MANPPRGGGAKQEVSLVRRLGYRNRDPASDISDREPPIGAGGWGGGSPPERRPRSSRTRDAGRHPWRATRSESTRRAGGGRCGGQCHPGDGKVHRPLPSSALQRAGSRLAETKAGVPWTIPRIPSPSESGHPPRATCSVRSRTRAGEAPGSPTRCGSASPTSGRGRRRRMGPTGTPERRATLPLS